MFVLSFHLRSKLYLFNFGLVGSSLGQRIPIRIDMITPPRHHVCIDTVWFQMALGNENCLLLGC
jgi:hypothetical protein